MIGRRRLISSAAAAALVPAAWPAARAAIAEESALDLKAELAQHHRMELRALGLLDHPLVKSAWQDGERQLRQSVKAVDPASDAAFVQSSREVAFLAVVNAMNQDPHYPGIVFGELSPRTVDGVAIPGSRGLDDNPDTVYRFVPVDGRARFEIAGRRRAHGPIVNEFSILTDDWITVGNLSGGDLVHDQDGRFTIAIDPAPAGARPNHIQTREGASYMVIRDTLANWSRDRPNLLSVRRLDPPDRPPLSDEALAEISARYVRKWFAKTIELHAMALGLPPNHFPQPEIRQTMGMLVTQAYSVGRFAIEPGQAVVLTLRVGGAGYAVVPVTNLWGITTDPVNRQVSLNTHQAARNPDGGFTFVLSLDDPGVANWIDPTGLPQGFLFLRWAAIDPHYAGADKPSIEAATMALADLARHAPAAMPTIDAATRRRQLAERALTHALRWEA